MSIHKEAWDKLQIAIEGKTGWGKNELDQLMKDILIECYERLNEEQERLREKNEKGD